MKKVLLSSFAAAAVLVSGAAYASDLVSEDSFFNNVANGVAVSSDVAEKGVSSTLDTDFASSKGQINILEAEFGAFNPR